jgi:hypothetical protein
LTSKRLAFLFLFLFFSFLSRSLFSDSLNAIFQTTHKLEEKDTSLHALRKDKECLEELLCQLTRRSNSLSGSTSQLVESSSSSSITNGAENSSTNGGESIQSPLSSFSSSLSSTETQNRTEFFFLVCFHSLPRLFHQLLSLLPPPPQYSLNTLQHFLTLCLVGSNSDSNRTHLKTT